MQQSCISEAQKYQGALYKEKPTKQSKKPVINAPSTSIVPRKAYVEDAPDPDTGTAVAIVDVPPPAPTPPPAVPPPAIAQALSEAVNVFDFLVTDETPNASKVSLGGTKSQMQMVGGAPPIFEAGRRLVSELEGDQGINGPDLAFEENGYSYGTVPVQANGRKAKVEFATPAPKREQNGSKETIYELEGSDRKSTDKKRKRHAVEELDLTAARSSVEQDEVMADAPALHTGLTGGLNRLLSSSKFPPSPDYSGGDIYEASPISPLKRTRPAKGQKERGRLLSALVSTRTVSTSRRTSDESRPRKKHSSHRHAHTEDRPKRKLKAIEYHSQDKADPQQQLVVYRTRAELFKSLVTKGPESETGCSMNKALKRYHRERGESGLGLGKTEEEKELWKALRLRRNERGEIVIFF